MTMKMRGECSLDYPNEVPSSMLFQPRLLLDQSVAPPHVPSAVSRAAIVVDWFQ